MNKIKIGFIPSNWESWNGGNWAEGMRDRCVAALKTIPGLDLVVPDKDLTPLGCVSDLEDAKKTLNLFRRENIQALLIGNMTFGMEVAVGAVLDGLPKNLPILHFCTRSGPIAPNGARSTDTWCGQFMTVSAIKRRGFQYLHLRTCNPEENVFKSSMETFVRAAMAIAHFRGAHIGQLGTRPDLFEAQIWNEQAMQKQFQQRVIPMDLDRVLTIIESIPPEAPEVDQVFNDLQKNVEVSDEYTETGLRNLARCEIGYRKIAREMGAHALAINCWTRVQERLGISVCSTLSRLTESGLLAACEVDIYGAATLLALFHAALGETKPHFIDWTDLHPELPNVWLAWHCGNAPISLRAQQTPVRLLRNERMIQWCPACHGALEFRLKEGPVTCARLVEYDGEFTMFFGNGEIINVPPLVRGAYGWVRVKDVGDWEQKMTEHGIIHHGALIHDPKVADALEMFCKFLGIKAIRGA